MGKKYLDTKQNSLESSILGVWQQAAEDSEEINDAVASVRMDGRTRSYREHRTKLEAARVKREARRDKLEVDETNKNDKSDDGEGLDAVQKDAVKKKFKDRKDKDIDNDGDTDDSDKYLHNRRKTVTKAVSKDDVAEDPAHYAAIARNNAAQQAKRDAQNPEAAKKRKDRLRKIAARPAVRPSDVGRSGQYNQYTPEEIDAEKLHKDSYEMGTDEYREYLEKLTPGEEVDKEWEQAKEFKVQSMKEALAKVWGLDEYITKEGARKKVNGGDNRRTEKEAHKPGHEDDEEEENGKKGKKGKADTGTGKPAAIEIDPTIKASKGY